MNKIEQTEIKESFLRSAELLALLGLLVYIVQSMIFAHTTPSNLDEGGYLYKGYLFATNVYHPFQPYGVWTNKAPLAFLIPGYVQLIFGAGLRTGRYLAVLEGILAVTGTWIVTRRMAGKWLAVAAVWVMALSPAVIKVYSVGASQPLVACLIAWMFVFSLGEERPTWQLIVSAILASVVILVRQNMIISLPLLLMYIFWQHGWQKGFWASFAGLFVFILGHVLYWPEILQIWLPWIPYVPASVQALVPSSGGGQEIWRPDIDWPGRLLSLFQGFRWQFAVMVGVLFSFLLLPQREKWKNTTFTRAWVFLSIFFIGSVVLHSYASLSKDYCVFCFAPYFSFYSVSGIILIALCFKAWNLNPHWLVQLALILLVIIISGGTGYSTFEDTGKFFEDIPVPRIRGGQVLQGFTTLGETLGNKFLLDQSEVRKFSALGIGVLAGFFVILVGFTLYRWYFKKKYNFGYVLANLFLLLGLVISQVLAGTQGAPDCKVDVIAANEAIGKYLNDVIPVKSKVYWDGGLSVAPLLYAPQAYIYPPQINDGYAYRTGGNTDELLRYGYWNDELASRWKAEADIIIIEEWRYQYWKSFLTPDKFAEFSRTPEGTSCLENTRLRIFKRVE
ncbi:MAG: glycosyltransferase family 39 protein [Anaerolineales bacterium]